MKYTVLLLLISVVACTDHKSNPPIQNVYTESKILDSFTMGSLIAWLTEYRDDQGDSILITCDAGDVNLLNVKLNAPLAYTEIINLLNDSLPEIILYECPGCDLSYARIFIFNQQQRKFIELKGAWDLIGDVFPLNNIDLFYNTACFNQGGCESALLRLEGDSLIRDATLYMPYVGDSITINMENKKEPEIYVLKLWEIEKETDSVIRKVWELKIKSSR